MNLERRLVTDPGAWDNALLALPDPHILQSWTWGQLKEMYGWRAERWLWIEGDRPVAAVQVLERRWPSSHRWPGARILYAPKGPALDWSRANLRDAVLADLARSATQPKAIFLKIDPDVSLAPSQRKVEDDSDRADGARLSADLAAAGWRPSREQVQFQSTLRLDLAPDETELLARMKAKTRYNIRLAERRGVRIRPATLDDLDRLYAMYTETAVRDGFVIRPKAYYLDAWGLPVRSGRAQAFLAEVEGAPVAGLILFHFGPTAWYFYGMSREAHRDRMPTHLLQWEAIRWAKAHGCRTYDFWGAPDAPDADEPMFGVYRFKIGFGAQHVRTIGAWDLPVRPFAYGLYTHVLPGVLAVLRARQKASTRRMVEAMHEV
ncbi:MAG: hypothetical protein A2Z17_02765 [Gammaproteobacteria bacterium RBG_16_66_13]|nr:MAG: hypothetical protein A2Z17_02765 [Gammaproteobacteria bacterium RBG_16_66_13]